MLEPQEKYSGLITKRDVPLNMRGMSQGSQVLRGVCFLDVAVQMTTFDVSKLLGSTFKHTTIRSQTECECHSS